MFQKIIIVGNLGGDPEMRYTPSGQAVTNFSVATNRKYTGQDGQRVDETVWFRVSAWGRQAETCNQYLKRGSKVLIEGRLTADRQTGAPRVFQRSDGSYGASFEITAQSVQFMSTRGEDETFQSSGVSAAPEADDDIPF
ncbi:MAG: single-stranded DNA-binding protein [Chloroflexi bacterium]|jgi:single-strand DNA-binding protein|nr:single-stranded DNA-binding protein [Chloroflexota bacterium]